MGNMMVRNLPDEVHDRLRAQAAANRRSLEAEVRSILLNSVIVSSGDGFGQRLRQRYGDVLGDDLSVARDRTASRPDIFE